MSVDNVGVGVPSAQARVLEPLGVDAERGAGTATGTPGQRWGWLPALSVVSALGLLLVALADTAARQTMGVAAPLFWAGLLVLFVPPFIRLTVSAASRRERIGLVMVLGLGFYLVKIAHSPLAFTFFDESLHWSTADDILRSHRLFGVNSLLPVSPLYPALEIVTSALASVSGLTIFGAGATLLGVGRLVFVLALYLFYERVCRSARVAGLAVLLYMTNPNFLFFDAQFAYESLGLPLAALVLFTVERRLRARDGSWLGLNLTLVLGIGAVVVTHHLTSYALAAFLIVLAIVSWRVGEGRRFAGNTGWTALLALVLALAWLVYVASLTIEYLEPNLIAGVREVGALIAGEAKPKQLFRSDAGQVAPLWERLTGFASVGLILLGLPAGLLGVWRRFRADAGAVALAIAALAYPVSLGLRLTPSGAELSNRFSEFVFVPLGFVLAVGIVEFGLRGRAKGIRRLSIASGAAVILMGGVIVGWPPWDRLPGPFLVDDDSRSIGPQGVAAAEWARDVLGPGNRVAADRTNARLMGSYGEQRVVTHLYDGVDVSGIFLASRMGPSEEAILRQGNIRYIVVDRRLGDALPQDGAYFEVDGPYKRPINPAALAKFDRLSDVSRVYDGGNIVIYDVGALTDAP